MKIQTLEDARAAFEANPQDPEAIHAYFTRLRASVELGQLTMAEATPQIERLGAAMIAGLPESVVANVEKLAPVLFDAGVPPEAVAALVMQLKDEGRDIESAELVAGGEDEGFGAIRIRLKGEADDGIGTPQGHA
jgi:hypothetical protein